MGRSARRLRLLLVGIVLAGVSVLLVGCTDSEGGGDDRAGDASPSSDLSPESFPARADQACTDASLYQLGGPAPYGAAQYDAIRSALVDLGGQLAALDAPEDLRHDVSVLLDGYASVATAADSAAQGVRSGKAPGDVQPSYEAAVSAPLAKIASITQTIPAPACGQLPVSGH